MKNLLHDLRWILPGCLATGLLLSWLDGAGRWWVGWLSASLFLLLGLTILAILWRSAGACRRLGVILLVALVLRLVVGIGLAHILPAFGHGTNIEQAGYVFEDAYARDRQAWELASTSTPVWEALQSASSHDQYGGLLVLSTWIYRVFSPDVHRPWLILLVGSLTAVTGIVLAWKATHRLWGQGLAIPVAWVLALYPEAVLQSASQMREPFLMTFVAMVFWGLADWQAGHRQKAWIWTAGGLVGLLLFHPGVAVFALAGMGGWFWLRNREMRISWRAVLVGLGVGLAALILLWLGLARGDFANMAPLAVLSGWLQSSARWDTLLLEQGSEMVEGIFARLPVWLHIPFATVYGLTQPVLPAAVADPTVWPWKVIAILRAAGWYALVPFLLAGLISAWKSPPGNERRSWIWLWFAGWGWIVLSAFRAGGDQWDNPRYRVIFLLWEALLAAQAWNWWRNTRTPWMGRLLSVEGVFLVFFSYWYAARYTDWTSGQLSLETIVAAILVISLAILLGGWLFDRRLKKRPAPEITEHSD